MMYLSMILIQTPIMHACVKCSQIVALLSLKRRMLAAFNSLVSFFVPPVNSVVTSCVQLTALAKTVSASTSAKSTVAAASGWTPAAISGLLDLWDQQSG